MAENKKNPSAPAVNLSVLTMPTEFYAGANPVIKFKNVEKEVNLNRSVPTPAEKKLADKITAAGGSNWSHPANLLTNRKFLILGGISFFVIFILAAGAYYWWQGTKTTPTPQPVATVTEPQQPTPEVISSTTTPETITEQPLAEGTEQLTSLSEPSMEFPSKLLSDSNDLDKDDLTDMAEEVFGTDPAVPDTDGDGYGDGHEVYNLYNPNGKEPIKLADSGAVLEFSNPVFGYKLYYPASWAMGNVDNQYRDVLFSTLTGENIEVRVFDMQAGQNFIDWFNQSAKGESYSDLVDFFGVFGEKGLRRNDFLVYYFTDGQKVFVIAYHTTDSNVINYRSIVKMIARSFRMVGNIGIVPEQIEEGGVNLPDVSTSSATSTL